MDWTQGFQDLVSKRASESAMLTPISLGNPHLILVPVTVMVTTYLGGLDLHVELSPAEEDMVTLQNGNCPAQTRPFKMHFECPENDDPLKSVSVTWSLTLAPNTTHNNAKRQL